MRAATEETRGRALASAITSTAASVSANGARPRTGGFERAGPRAVAQMAALAAMADDLYGPH